MRGDIVRGDYIDPNAGKIIFEIWARRWLESVTPTLKPSTAASYKSLLDSRVLTRFGKTPLIAVRPIDVQEWLGQMTVEGLSASRVRKCSVVLKMVMDAAVRDGLIRSNPVNGLKPPRIESREAAYLDPATVEQIASAMPNDEYALLVRVLGVGGLRFGEAAALTRDRIDLVRRRLLVRESPTEVGGHLVRTATKSYQERQVPIPPSLASTLTAHLESNVGARPDAPVFQSPRGGELRYRAFHGPGLEAHAGEAQDSARRAARPAPLRRRPDDSRRRFREGRPSDPWTSVSSVHVDGLWASLRCGSGRPRGTPRQSRGLFADYTDRP
jgi:integrase